MELLTPDIAPLGRSITHFRPFHDVFFDLMSEADQADIAVGYVTEESLGLLMEAIRKNSNPRQFSLTIGMHYLTGFTAQQLQVAESFHRMLKSSGRGGLRLVKPFRFHGKTYLFSRAERPFAGIIGSDNLSSVSPNIDRLYDVSAYIRSDTGTEQACLESWRNFHRLLLSKSTDFSDIPAEEFRLVDDQSLLDDCDGVEKVDPKTLVKYLKTLDSTYSFDMPLKGDDDAPKSNLNVSFGKGRENTRGYSIPRSWYEVELIVPCRTTQRDGYPGKEADSEFIVVTDDGWQFRCRVGGQNNKNFRSCGDLTTLGKWIKGRMERKGVLKYGDPVTGKTLAEYGRTSLTFSRIRGCDKWYLDFGVDNDSSDKLPDQNQ